MTFVVPLFQGKVEAISKTIRLNLCTCFLVSCLTTAIYVYIWQGDKRLFRGAYRLNTTQLDYYKFTFVRDPIDRFVSCFNFLTVFDKVCYEFSGMCRKIAENYCGLFCVVINCSLFRSAISHQNLASDRTNPTAANGGVNRWVDELYVSSGDCHSMHCCI